jgi:pSer/pThr/pTyr-binding forkhead associated (FHA) protein
MVAGRYDRSPAELAAMIALERARDPFVAYRDGGGELRLHSLAGVTECTIGRDAANDVAVEWDEQVSRLHARLELAGAWRIVDDGLSRNGTFVAGEAVHGRRRLEDGDVISVGNTQVLFRMPGGDRRATAAAVTTPGMVRLTAAQRRVLVALCRPLAPPAHGAAPATNKQIAAELTLSVEGVKTHMKALFEKLEIDDLPQNQKRADLARRALASGQVTARDLREAGESAESH